MSTSFDAVSAVSFFRGRRAHLAVSGSVACFRSADILRSLLRMGIHVSVTLSEGARQFVTPALFEALGALPVHFDAPERREAFRDEIFAHLEPGQRADAFVLAPASADALARLAGGRACDLLSAQALAFSGPLVVAPAMNPRMWAHPATQANVEILVSRGAVLVPPACGGTACGEEGRGRMAPPEDILLETLRAMGGGDMAGRRVMVVMGPTREPWDGVRFWSNPSTGRMGAALVAAAWLRGAHVCAVRGPGCPPPPPGVETHDVGTAREMFEAARDLWPGMDMGAFAAAVADFSPVPHGPEKFRKADAAEGFSVAFIPNTDILLTLARDRRPDQKVLGFAAETAPDMDALLALTRAKRARKNADLLAGNAVNAPGCGFGVPTNSMAVADAAGREEIWPMQSKADVAWRLWTWLSHM